MDGVRQEFREAWRNDVQENETASDELIAELLAGLDGVTPGPWLNGGLGLGVYTDLNDSGIYEGYVADADSHQDIAHIARCSPENIRALIARIALPTADGAQQPVTHSEQLRNSLQSVADELSKRPAELRGPFTMPTHQDAKREFEVMVAGPDGWSDWLRPVGDKYRMKCCDCGLVHNMEFRIDGNENINFRMSRGDTHPAPAPGQADAVSEAEIKAFRDTYREFFPGGGWPDKPTIFALLEAAQRARK